MKGVKMASAVEKNDYSKNWKTAQFVHDTARRQQDYEYYSNNNNDIYELEHGNSHCSSL
jgi:hypothetical protein